MEYAVQTEQLSKSFGDVHAVVGLNLTVEVGEVFGFLGPTPTVTSSKYTDESAICRAN